MNYFLGLHICFLVELEADLLTSFVLWPPWIRTEIMTALHLLLGGTVIPSMSNALPLGRKFAAFVSPF